MPDSPLVSIIMNCYNGEDFLKGSIDSVFNQTYSNWEIIFWDNASTDDSCKIANAYGPKIKLYQSEINTSLGKARSEAIKKANGEWLAFLDVDDIWLPDKLSSQILGLSGTEHIMSYGGIQEVDEDLSIINTLKPKWKTGFQLSSQLMYFEINLVTSMINRKKLLDLNLDFDERMQASEEYNLFMRLLPHGTVFVCEEILALYRVHASSLTYKKMERWSIERRITLNQILEKRPEIIDSEEFNIAIQQADYYEASYLMVSGQAKKARNLIGRHNSRPVFKILYFLTYLPLVWKILHEPRMKKRLTSFFKIN
jgi:glycosyltransferase involved in cell wall biosynthesis